MTKIVIFDIDGTLADLSHRLHYVKQKPKRWPEFLALAKDDAPIWPVVTLYNLIGHGSGYEVKRVLVSGRSEKIRDDTETWLQAHGIHHNGLYMRPDKDCRPDYVLKKEILGQIYKDFNDAEILFVVDDRQTVVDMWRAEGLICLQCAKWEE